MLTVCGTSPSAAGLKNAEAAPNSARGDEEERQRHVVREEHHGGERLDRGADAVAGEHHRAARQPVGDDAAGERERDARRA